MIKIEFEAHDVADLKLKIQDYALAHLGLNLQETVKNYLKRAKPGQDKLEGRKLGYRKQTETLVPAPVPAKENGEAGIRVKYSDCAKKSECAQMIAAVMGKFTDSLGTKGAYAKAKSCLDEFGVEHLDYLNPEAYNEFIAFCKKVMGAK